MMHYFQLRKDFTQIPGSTGRNRVVKEYVAAIVRVCLCMYVYASNIGLEREREKKTGSGLQGPTVIALQ